MIRTLPSRTLGPCWRSTPTKCQVPLPRPHHIALQRPDARSLRRPFFEHRPWPCTSATRGPRTPYGGVVLSSAGARHLSQRNQAEKAYTTVSVYSFAETNPSLTTVSEQRDALFQQLAAWQVKGRVYVSVEGLNAQISCPHDKLGQIGQLFRDLGLLHSDPARFEWNESMTPNACAFADLRVKIKRQVVSDGILVPAHLDIHRHWPNHISPQAFHAKLEAGMTQPHSLAAVPSPPVIDMRNHYEAEVGYFRGAVQSDADTFQAAMQQLDQVAAQYDPAQEILMYCTGGIRCTKAGAYLKAKGYKQVSVLKGGVTAYGHYIAKHQHPSHFLGKNFTFDQRRGERITSDVVGQCHQCGTKCDVYTNCGNPSCHLLFIQCPQCAAHHHGTCGQHICRDAASAQGTVHSTPSQPSYDYHHQIRPRLVLAAESASDS
ncbi:hypothetical protein H4R35_000804 [Dimargaris xerosporica]|nr:hypothetical protein H4R35_000804 [Dimargaris xerosporica]